MTELQRRCLDISYKNKLGHLSSVLTSVDIIDELYTQKKVDEPFVLGNSHAALALWVVLEKHHLCDAEEMQKKYGTHASRDMEHGVWVSGGSLGQPECVAVGMALADRNKNVYLVTSDGGCAEGSVWEALRVAAEQRLENLRIVVIANGTSALDRVDVEYLELRLKSFYPLIVAKPNLYEFPEWVQGCNGHYVIMDEKMYQEAIK